jgi:hypothetical protein
LAAVATVLGRWEVNIDRLETALKDDAGSVVDFLLEFPDDRPIQPASEEIAALDGVSVQLLTRYPLGRGLRYDLDLMQRMISSDLPPAHVFTSSAPLLCAACWALLVDAATLEVVLRTPLAPDLDRVDLAGLAPFDRSHPGQLRADPAAGSSTEVAVIALPPDQALVIGRSGGPQFTASELTRLDYLARAASGGCGSALGAAGARHGMADRG